MSRTVPSQTFCIHELFEQQAAAAPERVAVSQEGRTLTYRELNERANQLAHRLIGLGVTPDSLVGLFLERTPELLVGVLGILKAGAAYVPIDPQYPRERLSFMLQDSKAPVIVTQRSLASDLSVPGTRVLHLDDDSQTLSAQSTANPGTRVTPESLAYIIYTSGSTGTPKGTMITHRNVVRLFEATDAWYRFDAEDVWTLFHSCAFDFSVWEIWGALFYGGRLVVVSFGVSRAPENFYRLLVSEHVTVLNQTPSAFGQLIRAEEAVGQDRLLALRYVIFGGEALDFARLKPWFARHDDRAPQLVNMYGITETTVHVTYLPIRGNQVDSGSVIGEAIPDLQLYLLDEAGDPVAAGESGEICIGGAGLARGYLNRPDLTAKKFITHPLGSGPDGRLYRSGDLGRYLANGDLEYLGRMDQQVKLRGFRIELGEIVAVLNSHPSVRDSVVVMGETPSGEKALIGYLVLQPDQVLDIAQVRALLRERLPEYMVPSALQPIDQIPLTVNGKLDTKALPKPEFKVSEPAASAQNTGSTLERTIAAIWCDALQIPAVSLDQNFFDVGGSSMNLVEVHDKLEAALGREVGITDLFSHTTVRALAAHLSPTRARATGDAGAARASRQAAALANLRQQRSGKR